MAVRVIVMVHVLQHVPDCVIVASLIVLVLVSGIVMHNVETIATQHALDILAGNNKYLNTHYINHLKQYTMEKNIINRREFFKSATRKVLPTLAIIALPALFQGCEEDNYGSGTSSSSSGGGGCQGSCTNVCMTACEKNARCAQPSICSGSSCKAACQSTCKNTCLGSCYAGSR